MTSLNCYHYTIDKRAFKDICIKNGVSVAQDYHVSLHPTEAELEAIKFPVVVKAIDQSANRGMSYCFEKEDIQKAYKQVFIISSYQRNSKSTTAWQHHL